MEQMFIDVFINGDNDRMWILFNRAAFKFFTNVLPSTINPFGLEKDGINLLKDLIHATDNGYILNVNVDKWDIEVFVNDMNYLPLYDEKELKMFTDLIGEWLSFIDVNWECNLVGELDYQFSFTDPFHDWAQSRK